MAQCASCGTETTVDTRYCPSCGVATDVVGSGGTGTGAPPPDLSTAAMGTRPVGTASGRTDAIGSILSWPLSHQVLGSSVVLLLIALLVPWWSATIVFVGTISYDGFHSWGWLSFIAWLATAFLAVTVIARPKTASLAWLSGSLTARLVVVAGCVELLGDFLFIAAAPSVSSQIGSAGLSAGVVLAIIAGLATVYAGLLMIGPDWLPRPKSSRDKS